MNPTLDKLIFALHEAGIEFNAEELVDALWLASHLPASPPEQLSVRPAAQPELLDDRPQTEIDLLADDKQPQPNPERSTVGKQVMDAQLPDLRRGDSAIGTARGLPVSLTGATSLPEALAIARALRPLRKLSTTSRWFYLDEKRTAERLTAIDIWLPVLLPGRERWLSATIISDVGASMAIWRSMVNEFRGILQSLGAFRKIEARRMDTDASGNSVPIFAVGQSTAQHDPRDLADPTGRSCFLVISDCVGSAWWDGRVARLLEQWGRTNHTAILQILPRKMWDRTALGSARAVSLTSSHPVCSNANLAAFASGKFRSKVKLAQKGFVPVPILELEAASLADWARDAVSETGARFSGRLLPMNPASAPTAGREPGSQALGEPFLTVASVPARKLANLMAAAPPFNLPLLHVIRESRLSGEATQIHEAEFLLSGLLAVASNKSERVDDPDSVIYDFKSPELRAMLRSAVHLPEAIEVLKLDEVGEYLGRRLGRPGGLPAMIRAPQDYAGSLNLASTEVHDPFARFTADNLRWLGGKYAELLSVTKSKVEQSVEKHEIVFPREKPTTEASPPWDDYKRVIWYVHSANKKDESVFQHASAVAVRLWRLGEAPKTYLLTCAHAVISHIDLSRSTLRSESIHPVLTTLLGWRAGTGHTFENAQTLRIVATGNTLRDERVVDDEYAASLDWALLEFENTTENVTSAPFVQYWADDSSVIEVLACGYHGDNAFKNHIVMPSILYRNLFLYRHSHGLLQFEPGDLRSGISGAGLFDSDGKFAGILRADQLDSMQAVAPRAALSADSIRQQLEESGYYVVSDEVSIKLIELAQILSGDEFQDSNWREAASRVLQGGLSTANPDDSINKESLVSILRRITIADPHTHGVHPLHEFALILSRIQRVQALHDWIDRHVPTEIQKLLEYEREIILEGERKPTRPNISVLIAGTGNYELPSAVCETAERVGRWAAGCGFGLVTGGWQGVDHVAAREFAKYLNQKKSIEFWLTHVVAKGAEPDFKQGRVIEVQTSLEEYNRSIALASAVVLVGGVGGTWNVAKHAVQMRVPVFPLPWTEGDAAKFHQAMLEAWTEYEWMGIPRDRFKALSNPAEALGIIAEYLLRPIGKPSLPPPPAPQTNDATRMLFVSSKPPQYPFIRTDEELHLIETTLQHLPSEQLSCYFHFDLTWTEFQSVLASRKPAFLHFCGHAVNNRLVFRDAFGEPKRVETAALVDAIETCDGSLRVIVLNADDTGAIAKSIKDRWPNLVIIAPERVVTDDEAIGFAKEFYGQLANGSLVRGAFLYANLLRSEGAYSMWSESVDSDFLNSTLGFIDRREANSQNLDIHAAMAQATKALAGDANSELILDSIRSLEAIRKATPHDVPVAITLSRMYRALNRLPEALAVVTSAIEANAGRTRSSPDNAELLYNRASYYAILGQSEEALADLIRSFRLSPHNADRARKESDLESLRHERRFATLLDNPRPPRVLIVGSNSASSRREAAEFARYCYSLGKTLAHAGFGFVTGSYDTHTADRHSLDGVAAAKVPIHIAYIRPQSESNQPTLEKMKEAGHLVEWEWPEADWRVVRPLQVNAADVVVAIGGRRGTQQIIDIATSVGMPLISVPIFSGVARAAWPAVRQSLAKQGLGRQLIKRLNESRDENAVVEAIQFCLSRPHRDSTGLLSVEEIRKTLLRSGEIEHADEITGELLLFDKFDGLRQHTWLVATRDKIFFLLDDEQTRANDNLVQWTVNRTLLLPLSVNTSDYTVGFGSHLKPRWYYSVTLFPTPDELEAAVKSLTTGL